MSFHVLFRVDGPLVPKGRPRFSKVGGFIKTYTDSKTMDYEAKVREAAQTAMGSSEPIETPVGAFVYFRVPVPQSYSKSRTKDCLDGFLKPSKRPDLDNLLKAVLDAMNGVVYKDDGQLVSLHCTKVYASEPGVDVLIREELP